MMKKLFLALLVLIALFGITTLEQWFLMTPAARAQTNTFCASNLSCTVTGAWTFSNSLTVSGPATFTGGRPWIDVTGAPYNADPTGVADSTTAIQNAHNACAAFAVGPCAVYFPYGTYLVNSALTWSPYVPAVALSRVILNTPLASGNFISISDQYGKPTPDPNSNGTTRSKTFTGNFQIINTNAANTTFTFFIGGATASNFASELAIDGLGVTGFRSGVFKFGYNAFLVHITNFFGFENRGSYFSILAGATNTGEGMTIDSSTFGELNNNPVPAFLFSWNTTNASDFHFHNCSYDYLAGIVDPAQNGPNTSANITNSHFEWNEITNAYVNVGGGFSIKIVNAKFFSTLGATLPSPSVGRVAGASVLTVQNARYEFGGTAALLYDNTSGTAGNLLSLDRYVNTANPVTTYFTRTGGAGANTTFNSTPNNGIGTDDFSADSVGIGILYIGGNSAATNIPQIQANSASTCAGVIGGNYILLRAGVAVTECHSTTGDVGITGRHTSTGPVLEIGTICTNGELVLSAGWGTTATVTTVVGLGQTCEWTLTSSGTGQAASPTITDTLTNALPTATTVCEMRMVGGSGTATLIDQTTLSATAPVFTFLGTPVAASTYKVLRRCGP